MSLQIRQQLGSYEITSFIGKGGMGEVYRARDTRLKRDVAIKILPDEFSLDTDRVSRFQREAESLAALNHPNIAAIYDLQQSGVTRFLILEFVEGDTLADILKRRGALPVDEALQIAKQICEALEAAHERGIIHRDLKPANVKITPDGRVKVLDFGLAKAFALETSNAVLSDSPTLNMAATNPGVILGTAAYMPPEQAKGRTVDRRTDVFAFGALLFEMLTGHPAFGGDDVQDVLGAVLKSEPEWTRLPSDLPASIQRLLRLCLQKDMKKRRQTATDVRIDIEQALDKPEVAPATSRTHERLWMGAALLFLIGIVSLAILHFRGPPPAKPFEMRTEIVTPATTDPTSLALSPDGRQIVFVASGDGRSRLWIRSLTTSTIASLPGTEGATFPFWSPDSRAVGFFTNRKLKRLKLGGGSPEELAEVVGPRGGTENADGVILFTPNTSSPVFRVLPSGGLPVAVTKLDRQTSHRFPVFLPDGRQFLFYAWGTPETAGIYLASLDSAETTRLTGADTAGLYLSSGWLLWVQAGALVGQHLDLERKQLSGDLVTLADRVVFNGNSAARGVSVSAAGMVAYRAGGDDRRQLAWFDRAGNPLGTMNVPAESDLSYPAVSPKGLLVAAQVFFKGITDIWLLDGARTNKFTADPARDYSPIWSPEGSRIVFASNRKGHRDIFQKPFSADGVEELLVESSQDKIPTHWSRDGRFILYHAAESQTNQDLWVLSMDGEHHRWKLLGTSYDERFGQFRPDGRWVAYMSNESGPQQIYILPFAGLATPGTTTNRAAVPVPISTTGGTFPRWRSDGTELYYIGLNGEMMAASITVTGTKLVAGTPVQLFPTRIYGGGAEDQAAQQYDVDQNGRFLIDTVLDDSSPITLIQNWQPPAK